MHLRFAPIILSCLVFIATSLHAAKRPNVVVMLADDLGIECLSSYGGLSHKTPNIDRLVSQGMRFSHAFSHPYCSPSRASLLTGRYPFKNGMKMVIWHAEKHKDVYVHTNQPSFARELGKAGYTTALAGKWQLSFLHQRNTINDFGFDQYQCWQIYDKNKKKRGAFTNRILIATAKSSMNRLKVDTAPT